MDDLDVIILNSLLVSRDKYISGNFLAKKVGISRVGIWARLEKLRGQGFTFDAVRHRGYRTVSYTHLTLPTNREV